MNCRIPVASLATLAALTAVTISASAAAAEPSPSAPAVEGSPTPLQLGVRVGWAQPYGRDAEGIAMSELFAGQLGLAAEGGWMVRPHLMLGGIASLGLGGGGRRKSDCPCLSATLRAGAQVHYYVAPDARVNPWVGYGIGLERTRVEDDSFYYSSGSVTETGVELGHVMGGFNVRVNRDVAVGPFVDFSAGKYLKVDPVVGSGFGPSTHEWLQTGLRLSAVR